MTLSLLVSVTSFTCHLNEWFGFFIVAVAGSAAAASAAAATAAAAAAAVAFSFHAFIFSTKCR